MQSYHKRVEQEKGKGKKQTVIKSITDLENLEFQEMRTR